MQNYVIKPTEFLTCFLWEELYSFPKEGEMETRPSLLHVEHFASLFII